MPQASQRAMEMPASPIRRLMPLATQAESHGIHVHYLNIGQPDIFSPEAFWKGVREYKNKTLAYSPSPGYQGLRDAALEDFNSRGIPLESSELLVTTGGSEATFFAFLACFNPGDEVIVVEPYYANYSGFAVESGVKLVVLTSSIETNFELPAIEQFDKVITNKTRGILICNPSNPTGVSYTEEHFIGLAKLVKQHNLFLIVDEVYRDFNYTDTELTPILTISGLAEYGVMIDSLSKRMSLCGARIGFLASHNKSVMEGAVKLAQARLSSPTLDQAGAAMAIADTPPSYFADIRKEFQHRKKILVAELAKIPGVICPKIEGAFYAFVRLPVDDAELFCKWMLTDFQLDGETILMAPGEGFYLTPGLGKNEVRIAYVLKEDKLVRAIQCLGAGLGVYPGRTERELAHSR